jgi:hypothetical protein
VSDQPPSTDETPKPFAHDRQVRPDRLQGSRGFGRTQTPLTGRVEAILAGLDEADPAAHADAFEAVDAAILAELQRLESL